MRAGGKFQQAWLAESIRLREAHAGPLHDSNEVRRARAEGGSFSQRISRRAQLLGEREKLDQTLWHWWVIARWSLAALLVLAVLTGFGTALGAMGDGARPVNLLMVLAATLGLNLLTLLLWFAGLGVRSGDNGAWLGRVWLDVTQRLARGPDAALAPRALAGLLGRSGALRWSLSAGSHLAWLTALTSLLLTLLGVLSARRYTFNWETTLLSPDAFVGVTQALGWLPAKLGFTMPDEATIRISDGLHILPPDAHALWSNWLIGCVVVYGVIPRLAVFLFSGALARRGIRQAATLDTSQPGYASLRPRLMPPSEGIAPDAAAGADSPAQIVPAPMGSGLAGGPIIVGLELAPDTPWPPASLSAGVHNAGVIDTRDQRHALLDQLHAAPVPRLLVVCDSYQTPDRGTLAYIAELASYADQTRVTFTPAPAANHAGGGESRIDTWRSRLQAAGVSAQQIHVALADALAWVDGVQP